MQRKSRQRKSKIGVLTQINVLLSLVIVVFSLNSYAFVENVTHGYPNCMACHVAPSGGGLLTDYGRSLSKELMSTWGWAGAEEPLFGAVKNKEWLKVGGDVRSLQTYFENDQVKQGQQFIMQKNIELGLRLGKTWLVGTLGSQEGPKGTPGKERFLSERHYLLWETSEDTRVRVGKFRLNFGLNDPNHTRVTKGPLGFGSNSETYNLEFFKMADNYELVLSTGLGRLDIPRDSFSERSLSASYSQYVGTMAKTGVSALIGESAQKRRSVIAAFGVLPFTEDGVIKFEMDFQKSTLNTHGPDMPSESQSLFAGYLSGGYRWVKGFMPYLFVEYLHTDLSERTTKQQSPGVGLQWLPVPHLELQAEYKRQSREITPGNIDHVGWLLFHFYL